jgi:exodeoxyribonuclease VIII
MSNAIKIHDENQTQLVENFYEFPSIYDLAKSPGIYDISEDEYHEGPGISRSSLMEFTEEEGRCPYNYWYKYNNNIVKKEEKPHFLFGHALHTFFLEPEEFQSRFIIIEKMHRGTLKYKKLISELEPTLNGRQIINKEDYKKLQEINKRINEHEIAPLLINNDKAEIEKSLYWVDKDSGVLCKSRPDIMINNVVVDLKSSKDLSYKSFRRDIEKYGYHIQAAMIRDSKEVLLNKKTDIFINLCFEKTAPYLPRIFQIDPVDIDQGQEIYKKAAIYFKECRDTDTWPTYKSRMVSLNSYN